MATRERLAVGAPTTPAIRTNAPLIIQYTNLLHEHRDPKSKPVRDFVKSHSRDAVFIRRVEVLNRLWRLKKSLVVAN